jgi:hypothetical protein
MWTTMLLHLLIPTVLMVTLLAWPLAMDGLRWLWRRGLAEHRGRQSEPRLRAPASRL